MPKCRACDRSTGWRSTNTTSLECHCIYVVSARGFFVGSRWFFVEHHFWGICDAVCTPLTLVLIKCCSASCWWGPAWWQRSIKDTGPNPQLRKTPQLFLTFNLWRIWPVMHGHRDTYTLLWALFTEMLQWQHMIKGKQSQGNSGAHGYLLTGGSWSTQLASKTLLSSALLCSTSVSLLMGLCPPAEVWLTVEITVPVYSRYAIDLHDL